MVKKITGAEFDKEVMTGSAVVDFSAGWCGPCKMLAPVLEEVSEEMSGVRFYNVDVDSEPDLAIKYRISNIPAILVMKDGEKKDILVGFMPKEVLADAIRNLL